jgi:hypothetical protein
MWIAALSMAPAIMAQSQTNSTTSAPASGTYVNAASVPGPVQRYLAAFGDRVQNPGKGRTIFRGTYSAKNGSGQAQLTWEVPGNIRFDRSDQPGKSLIINKSAEPTSSSGLGQTDTDILESLSDDSAEAFFYGFQNGVGHRLLGQRFRADDGNTVNYQGPWYDVYAAHEQVAIQPGSPARVKHFYFDSQTGLLTQTRYLSSGLPVTTEFSNWVTNNGQSFPGRIVRKENGAPVFTFDIASGAISPAQNDGTFSGQ